MRRDITISRPMFDTLRSTLLKDENEVSMYALIGVARTPRRERILVRELLPLAESDYARRTPVSIQVKPSFINRVAGRCERENLGLLLTHSHPFEEGDVWFSPTDDAGEERVLRVFHELGVGAWPLASLVLAPRSIKARVWDFASGDAREEPIEEIRIIGDHIDDMPTVDARRGTTPVSGAHARQVLALGAAGQARLARARVAIIGAGGTGSACFEMLARLGVGEIALIDDDTIEESNLSRIYGSCIKDVGRPKVDALAAWAREISRARVEPVRARVQDAAEALLGADVILSCTDTESSRAFANQIAAQYMIPMIDVGNRIDSSGGRITSASTRLTYVAPDKPCLECYGSIQHDIVAAQMLPRDEYAKRKREGYVADLDAPNPSVISLNSFVASQAVTKLLDVLTGSGGPPHDKWTYNYLTGELRPAMVQRRERCVCTEFASTGDMRPLPFGKVRPS